MNKICFKAKTKYPTLRFNSGIRASPQGLISKYCLTETPWEKENRWLKEMTSWGFPNLMGTTITGWCWWKICCGQRSTGALSRMVIAARAPKKLQQLHNKKPEDQKLKDLRAKNYLFQSIDKSILKTIIQKDTSKQISRECLSSTSSTFDPP